LLKINVIKFNHIQEELHLNLYFVTLELKHIFDSSDNEFYPHEQIAESNEMSQLNTAGPCLLENWIHITLLSDTRVYPKVSGLSR